MPHFPIPMIRNDGRQPCAVQGLPPYGSGRFVRSCAMETPTTATAAAQGQRRIFGLLLLRPVVNQSAASLGS